MTPQEQFEALAREAGDALLVVPQNISGESPRLVIAMARLGDWAVIEPAPGDIPTTKSGRKSRAKNRWAVVTHAPSGLKVGVAMPRDVAMTALRALADIPADCQATILANRERILSAIPADYRIGGAGSRCNADSEGARVPAEWRN